MPSLEVSYLRRWQLLLFVFLSLNLLLLAGCSPDAASLEATTAAQAGQIAAATVAAWPTETSAATLTPLPSLTSQPALTPQPTFTSQPTLTPLPTLTPQPTLTQPPTPTATATPTETPTRVLVTAAPPQAAFSLEKVVSVNAYMGLLMASFNGACTETDYNGNCRGLTYVIDCAYVMELHGQYLAVIVSQPGTSDPQTVGYHNRYMEILSAFNSHISGYISTCQDTLANNGPDPYIPRSVDYTLAYDQYAAMGRLLSEMENSQS